MCTSPKSLCTYVEEMILETLRKKIGTCNLSFLHLAKYTHYIPANHKKKFGLPLAPCGALWGTLKAPRGALNQLVYLPNASYIGDETNFLIR